MTDAVKPMVETPCFFPNGSYQLFGVLHEPVSAPSGVGWVLCHPFAEEKLWAQRVYVSFARALAARGAWVLRFDTMGNGDSDGSFAESSVESALSDVSCAIRLLERSARHGVTAGIGLLGLRFGATLAAMAAEQDSSIRELVLWEPILDGARYMQEMLRINLTTQTAAYKEIRHSREDLVRMMRSGQTVNIDGYELAYPHYEQISMIKLADGPKSFAGRCLIVQIGRESQPVRQELETLRSRYPQAEVRQAAEEPFWKEIKRWYAEAPKLFDVTLSWIDDR